MIGTGCVVKVGGGRGFIIEQRISNAALNSSKQMKAMKVRLLPYSKRRLVITAAHCLPDLPPAHGASLTEERTCGNLLGQLQGKNNVAAECLFVDPVADIAVLGATDGQMLSDEEDSYFGLTDDAPALPIGNVRSGKGWMLSLENPHWIPADLLVHAGRFRTRLNVSGVLAGMSGSPILNRAGRAVGVVVLNDGPHPVLTEDLPAWLVRCLSVRSRL